ncbi:nuclear transport factor 2 family protein [Brevundimonas variabilis]|uniref:Limonene-1,2-epoxide hydrolase n=1 Tax=Brevundimonas variabilis TaxID=74312 RepID=A0A7W9CKX2_9CAUL|nr:nuclear transport factor 2 family protein [Brevundimonas variabilis]MBB5747092.1 limonene-1,2-epoxide hydrolase [Brevundimonas variabilis]
MPENVVQAFAREIAFRDVRRLEPYLGEHVAARFDIAGDLIGRKALLGFWRRLFQTYSLFEFHILKCVVEDELVMAEGVYLLATRHAAVLDVRAISIFEVEQGIITHWRDHADLTEVPMSEKDRWRRLSGSRW